MLKSITTNFEKRQKTYPQEVKGKFRKIKNLTNLICLNTFFLFPFIRWERGSSAPNQAILIDLPNSRAYFFFIEMWPEEVYYIAGLLIFAAISLFFITSLFGRIWCGYSCPQTVWTDIFIKIERFFQGDRNDRIKLDRKTFSWKNIYLKIVTHLSWIAVSLVTGVGFALYFNDAPSILQNIINFNLSIVVLGWILGIGGATYIMAGFAREQVCNYMCPYARFQSSMFDPNTLIIAYDENRGEKRGKFKKGDNFDNRGHCIDCKQCVVVCPQNIDIRNGLQMECIACGLCIDACNSIMKKMDLPIGLIKYNTQKIQEGATSNVKLNLLRPRTFYYVLILIIVGSSILFKLSSKDPYIVNIIADRNPMFVTLSNGDIRNGYTIKISNKTNKDKIYNIKVSGMQDLSLHTRENITEDYLLVKAREIGSFKIYVKAKSKNLDKVSGRNKVNFTIADKETGMEVSHKAIFISE